jgi:hypothetical protein
LNFKKKMEVSIFVWVYRSVDRQKKYRDAPIHWCIAIISHELNTESFTTFYFVSKKKSPKYYNPELSAFYSQPVLLFIKIILTTKIKNTMGNMNILKPYHQQFTCIFSTKHYLIEIYSLYIAFSLFFSFIRC